MRVCQFRHSGTIGSSTIGWIGSNIQCTKGRADDQTGMGSLERTSTAKRERTSTAKSECGTAEAEAVPFVRVFRGTCEAHPLRVHQLK
jgi:hypothetical protein